MLEHQSPLNSVWDGRVGDIADEPALRVTLSRVGLLLLQSRSESILQDALRTEIGLDLPAPQAISARVGYSVLWLAPAEWLVQLPANETASLQIALSRWLEATLSVVTHVSDAWACFEISGPLAAEALMSGCRLDLSNHAFPSGPVGRTMLADVPAIIWNRGGDPQAFLCLVDRSFAGHLRDWLRDAVQGRCGASAR